MVKMSKQSKNYYYNSISANIDIERYDFLLTNINGILFDYSDHHLSNKPDLKKSIKNLIRTKFFWLLYLRNKLSKWNKGKNIIISNAYVNIYQEKHTTMLPPWIFSPSRNTFCSLKLIKIIKNINDNFKKKSIRILLSSEFESLINAFKEELLSLFEEYNVNALIVPNDLAFFENLAIKTAKEAKIPTFVYLHGMPGRYNNVDDNRADYLIVWGKGLKELYVKNGVDENKILTLKHPTYSSFKESNIESNLTDVLVLTKATCGTPSTSTELILTTDRSIVLYYTELVKQNLKKLGVKKATLRLHPSEDPDFYVKNLPDDFFTIDTFSKEKSLAKASLVIGPTSTMVLDAIKSNKNYILFDPVFDGVTLEGMPLVTPFTGESFIKLSNSYDEISYNIKNPNINISFKKLNDFLKIDSSDEEKFLNILNRTY